MTARLSAVARLWLWALSAIHLTWALQIYRMREAMRLTARRVRRGEIQRLGSLFDSQ